MRVPRSLPLWACCLVLLSLVACGNGDSTPNTPPSASITLAALVPVTAVVTLNGGGSVSNNGGTLTYGWSLSSKPVGSNAVISNATAATAALNTDVVGTYVVMLTVNDGKNSTSTSTSLVASAYTPPMIIDDIVEPVSGTIILSLSPEPNAPTTAWTVDGTAIGTGTGVSTISWDTTTVANGTHVVVAVAQFSGYTITESRTIRVSQTAVSFSSATVTETGGVFTATVGAQSTNGILRVSATLDGVAVGSLTTPNSGSNGYQFTGPVGSGAHIVVVTATDGAGNQIATQLRFTVTDV